MLNNLRDLYQQVIIDHGKRPHNFCAYVSMLAVLKKAIILCAAIVLLYMLMLRMILLKAFCFQGQGCAISTASASLMTEAG